MGTAKRVLLGSAAGLLVVASAQAADLPVKAVEYVKVCSLYGAGFWYVPGTDTCLKIGAYTKLDTFYGANGGGAFIGGGGGGTGDFGGANTRTVGQFNFRNRNDISFDMRTQTEYGTLRSYIDIGSQVQSASGGVGGGGSISPTGTYSTFGASSIYVTRAFLQFAGITAGRMRSFYDMVFTGTYALAQQRSTGDSSPNGIVGIAYTWQFGGGLSASFSLEDSGYGTGGHGRSIINLSGGTTPPGPSDVTDAFGLGTMFTDISGDTFFDPVFNVRIDQAWGFAGFSAALHSDGGGYYGCGTNTAGTLTACAPTGSALNPSTQNSGHPNDKFGYALAAAFTLTNVFGLQGDSMGAQFNWTKGASGYATAQWGPQVMYGSGNRVSMGWIVDGIYNNGTQISQTTVWTTTAYYEHVWNPKWRTSLYGGLLGETFDSDAKAMICPGGANGTPSPVGFSFGAQSVFANAGNGGAAVGNPNSATGGVTNCNPDTSWTQLGSRTLWNPVPDLDIAVDVSWVHTNTAFAGQGILNNFGTVFQPTAGGRPGGTYNITNLDNVSAFFRIQRNFLY